MMYEIKKHKPFYSSLNYLKIMRQIPASTNTAYIKRFNIIFLLSKICCFFFTAVGPILHLIVSVMDNSGKDLTEDISIALGPTGGGVTCLLFTLKYQEWSNFFNDLVDTRRFGKPPKLEENINRLNHLGDISFFCSSWVTIIYAAAAWYSAKGCQLTNDQITGEICPVFAPIWLPFGADNMTAGSIVFVLQTIFIGFLTGQPFLTECFVMYESTEILISHISHLNILIGETFDAQSSDEIRDRLRYCIDYHVHILKLGYRLSSLIKYTVGHMTLLSAVVCGCIANQVLNTKPLGSFIFLAAWLLSLLCFCHSGQRIKDKTLSVSDAVWESKWYKADARTLKDVQFILLRCQKPIYFEAIPLGVTDYPFYFMMIRTGYQYFALFHQSL